MKPVIKRGTLAWYRYRMFTGVIFSILGVIIGVELVTRHAPIQNKIAGLGFALVAVALGLVRIVHYLQARAAAK